MNRSRTASKPYRILVLRLLLVLASLVISLVLGELLFRTFEPKPYSRPLAWFPEKEKWIPIGEIMSLVEGSEEDHRDGPGTRFRALREFRCKYDRPRWDYFDEDGCIDYHTNEFGFRDDSFSLKKGPDEYRILALGDSFTMAVGVRYKDGWVEVLEQKLHDALNRPVQVINGGFAQGYMPAMYKDWIESDGIAFEPDAVIIGLCLNDMHVAIPMLCYTPIEPADAWLGGRSRMLYHLQCYLHRNKELNDETKDFALFVDRQPECWDANKKAMEETKAFLDKQRIRFIIAVLPMISGLQDHYPYKRLHDMVDDFCKAKGIECVDLLDRFLGRNDRDLWVHPMDQHPNNIGQRLIGEGLFDYMMTHRDDSDSDKPGAGK
ncbi:MAG: GDSL-type esterase/lipase family protein [Planctomycetota bacterium]